MYLTRLILNARSRVVHRDRNDCQHLHRTVMSGFPDLPHQDARVRFEVLYRLDASSSGRLILYVQSRFEPDWSRLPPDYLDMVSGTENPACKSVSEVYSAIPGGAILAFRLRANPTRKINTKSDPDGRRRNGKRVELRREEEQIAWLQRKAESGGFALLQVQTTPGVPDLHQVPDKAEGHHPNGKLTFGAVTFEGRLRVTDPAQFAETIRRGIGSAKAYGFGLLSIARG